jgi:hypothetical protein
MTETKLAYWTIPELAKLWGFGRSTVSYLIEREKLKAFSTEMPSGRIHYRITDAERLRYEESASRGRKG